MMRFAWQQASPVRRSMWIAGAAAALLMLGFMVLIAIELVAFGAINTPATGSKSSENKALIVQGEYLAKLGNCAACHSARGGEPFAGGKAIHTPFGAVYASNITPDPVNGIGAWSSDAFYRALQQGVNAKGRLLTPAFPYPNYTQVSRADSDALYAYFQHGVKPIAQPSQAHELAFPFNTQLALAVWRVLFFSPLEEKNTPNSIASRAYSMPATGQKGFENEVERGRYIVNGLAHCSACHAQRNALGAASSDGRLAGALMPMQDWYAPSLHAKEEAGVQHWPREQVIALLKDGANQNASALGPMAEVVAKSTQYWRDEDLSATAAYLQSLPLYPAPKKAQAQIAPRSLQQGAALYTQHCATCHADNGQGLQEADPLSPLAKVNIPALAGNRAVSLSSSANLVRIILAGGYAPATRGNPRPFGMPPFVHVLSDEDIAFVVTYIRASWGNQADAVSASEVVAQRRGVLQ
jgi:mono/diheme cytochrome c family protein